MLFRSQGEGAPAATFTALLTEEKASFTFTNVPAGCAPSLLRGFSAPVRLQYAETPAQLLHRLAHDSDPFNRWEAGQTLLLQAATRHASASANPGEPALNGAQMEALRAVLRHPQLDAAFKALALTLPAESDIAVCPVCSGEPPRSTSRSIIGKLGM